MYGSNVEDTERNRHQNEYRKYKQNFKDNVLSDVNDELKDDAFSVNRLTSEIIEGDATRFNNDWEEIGFPSELKPKG